jgi:hypothetical protein
LPERRECPVCGVEIIVRKDGKLRVHWLTEESAMVARYGAAGARQARGDILKAGDPCPGGAVPEPKSIEDKARRYIAEGHVKVARVTPTERIVHVQGSKEAPYVVRVLSNATICPCEAKTWRCAHVVAALLVVDPPEADETVDELDKLLAPTAPSTVSEDIEGSW